MWYGVNTAGAFTGRCVPLRKKIDDLIECEYGEDPPANIAYLFQLKLLRELCSSELRLEHPAYVEALYRSIDDPTLIHALDEDHLWCLTVNASGYYLANCLPKGY